MVDEPIPNEAHEASLASYVVNPPDVLIVDVEPKAGGAPLQAGDEIWIDVQLTLQQPRVAESLTVEADGTIKLPTIGDIPPAELQPIKVAGLRPSAVQQKLAATIKGEYPNALVTVQSSGARTISGQFLVRPDGAVKLGDIGTLPVAGRSLAHVEAMLKELLLQRRGYGDAKVSVDVLAYNSMKYYVIADGGGFGDQVQVLPFTGRERVLDAIGELGGMPNIGSRINMWIARPTPGSECEAQIMPVNWEAVSKYGQAATNYQLMPGDRLYIKADRTIAADNVLSKLLAPIDRVLSTISLGAITQQSVTGNFGGAGGGGS
jgi:protein involved in polysaccharide export with SLBB domain